MVVRQRTLTQQIKYTERKLREAKKLLEHFRATAAVPPAERQQRIMTKQEGVIDALECDVRDLYAIVAPSPDWSHDDWTEDQQQAAEKALAERLAAEGDDLPF